MSDLQTMLRELAAERLGLLNRHEASARVVAHYDFNNTYQYVISREETHVRWLRDALAERGDTTEVTARPVPAPQAPKPSKRVQAADFQSILQDDARYLGAFVERWRPRVEAVTHARHRIMLQVVLGESLEHGRLFEQAASGFEDLLGRRTTHAERVGGVLPTRWQE